MPDGRIAWAVGDQYEIRIRDTFGETNCIISRGASLREVSARERDEAWRSTAARVRRASNTARVNPDPYLQQIRVGDHHPMILGLWADQTGRLWVRVPAEQGETFRFDAYGENGSWLGTVVVEESSPDQYPDERLIAFGRNHLYVVAQTPDDYEIVRAYQIPGLGVM